jgi:hypothetical protein
LSLIRQARSTSFNQFGVNRIHKRLIVGRVRNGPAFLCISTVYLWSISSNSVKEVVVKCVKKRIYAFLYFTYFLQNTQHIISFSCQSSRSSNEMLRAVIWLFIEYFSRQSLTLSSRGTEESSSRLTGTICLASCLYFAINPKRSSNRLHF